MKTEEQWHKDKFQLYWYDDARTIFVIACKNSYTWSDYYMMMQTVGRMVKNSPHPIVYVNVWDENIQLPEANPLPHSRVMNRILNPRAMVFVIRDTDRRDATRIYCNIMGFKENKTYWIATTFEEGLQIAQAQANQLHGHDSDVLI